MVPELNEIKLVKPANLKKIPNFLAPKINLKSFAAEVTAEYIFHNVNSDWTSTTRNNRLYPFVVETISKVKEGRFTVEIENNLNHTIDLGRFSNGIYSVRIISTSSMKTIKLIKQ